MQNCNLSGNVGTVNGVSQYNTNNGNVGYAVRFSIAIRDQRAKKDDPNGTDFFNCVLFTTSDKVVAGIQKGAKMILSGRFKTSKYEKNGETRTGYEFIVEDYEFGEKLQQSQGQQAGQMQMPQTGVPQMPTPTPQAQPQMTMPQMAAPMPQVGVPVQNAAPQMATPAPAPVPNVTPQPMPQMGVPVTPQPVPMQSMPGFSTPAGMDFSGAIPDIGNLPFN